jgi:hypothetical protein
MTKDEIRAIRERAGKASEGPWESHGDSPGKPPMVWDNSGDAIVSQMPNGRPYFEPEDANFIAHARTDVPALCDAVEEARKVLRKVIEIEGPGLDTLRRRGNAGDIFHALGEE